MNRTESDAPATERPQYELIELLFFAYRDFVGDPDRILAAYGFGRAHHRVLHFVHRNPGLTIAALLDILKITKQSLNRVLKELLEQGFVEQRAGVNDRRQRLLYPTARGRALADDMARLQTRRIARALEEAGPGSREAAARFLEAMIEPAERPSADRLVHGGRDEDEAQ
ncbi:MarR family transcriptional regulator [Alsobacter sp. SYSU M60028]|uniref:MarR family transcriptional regulator n=2 Tax=Alsobacter ponti TaxID=2962936 RepID=A0ABT1L6L0_9HYPH|nr:MarR family transcriptional regulator [Alsobacter ponti]MCP8937034.1 MarR family transcriptional regulator [Alsobacter ponti]